MSRVIDFVDGVTSETPPTIGNIVASNLTQYADDSTYEANEDGAPTTGNLYYNTTDNVIRYYNGSSWESLVDENTNQVVQNKSIDADNNTITNIDDNDIKSGAGINATKVSSGDVDNTEFDYLNGVTSSIQTQLDSKIPNSEKGSANGVATLDGSSRIPSSQLPTTATEYLGAWNADTNSPSLSDGSGTNGDVYRISVAGSQDLGSGSEDYEIGDVVIYNGSIWEKIPADDQVQSVNGQNGIVSLGLTDLDDVDVTPGPSEDGKVLKYDDASGDFILDDESGGSGVGGINYITNSDGEAGVTDWNTYDDGGAIPTDGTGGSPSTVTATPVTIAAEVLRGTQSLGFVKSAADGQGEGWSTELNPVDVADREGKLQVSFEYKNIGTTPENYVSGDVKVYVYDVDNAQLLNVINDNDGDLLFNENGKFTGEFYTTDADNYRLIFHITSTNALAWALSIDNVIIGPSLQSLFVNMTNVESFGDNVTGSTSGTLAIGTGGGAKADFRYAENGQFVEAIYNIRIGTSGTSDVTGTYIFPLPKEAANGYPQVIGFGTTTVVAAGGSDARLIAKLQGNNGFYLDKNDANQLLSGGDGLLFDNNNEVSIYIRYIAADQKATNIVNTNQLNQQTIHCSGQGNAGTALTANVTDIDFIEVNDPFNAWNGTIFTAPKKARYKVLGFVRLNSSTTMAIDSYINGTINKTSGAETTQLSHGFHWEGILQKGDQLSFRVSTGSTLSNSNSLHWIEISSIPDFSVYGIINPNTKVVESNSGLISFPITAGQYGDLTSIIPEAGTYDIDLDITVFNNAALSGNTNIHFGLGDTSGNSSSGLSYGDTLASFSQNSESQWYNHNHLTIKDFVADGTSTYYFKAQSVVTIGNLEVAYKISARKIK